MITTVPPSSGRVTTMRERRRPTTSGGGGGRGTTTLRVLAGPLAVFLLLAASSPPRPSSRAPAMAAAAACGGCMLPTVTGPRRAATIGPRHPPAGAISTASAAGLPMSRPSVGAGGATPTRHRPSVAAAAFARHPAHLAASFVFANGLCHLGASALHRGLDSLERRFVPRADGGGGEADGHSKDPTADTAGAANNDEDGPPPPSSSSDAASASAAGGGGEGDPMSSSMVASIRFYRNFISPLLPPACRFLPTCSQYGVQAIREFGPTRGAVLTAWRLLRCSPIGGRGYDPPRWPPVAYNYGSY